MNRLRYGGSAIGRCLALALLLLQALAIDAADAQERQGSWGVEAGQPLGEALSRFGKRHEYDIIVAEALVEGERAAPVEEARSAYDALTQMLAGTGLVPRFIRRNAIILERAAPITSAELSLEEIDVLTLAVGTDRDEYRWYGEKLLGASLALLRRSGKLAARSYDFTLYVWLSADGRIVDLDGVGTQSNSEALAITRDLLSGMAVGLPPPRNMPQPVGLRIVAQ